MCNKTSLFNFVKSTNVQFLIHDKHFFQVFFKDSKFLHSKFFLLFHSIDFLDHTDKYTTFHRSLFFVKSYQLIVGFICLTYFYFIFPSYSQISYTILTANRQTTISSTLDVFTIVIEYWWENTSNGLTLMFLATIIIKLFQLY